MNGWDRDRTGGAHVLHVDDDPAMLDLTARQLERQLDDVTVTTAVGATDGLDALGSRSIDCVVSDYDMPGMDGIEFLQHVRDTHPDLPFVLYTGEGSESIASDALAAGATDYVQKGTGSERSEVLANRVQNAVEAFRAKRDQQRTAENFRRVCETAPVPIGIVNDESVLQYANDAAVAFFDADDAASLVGTPATELVHADDRERATDRVRAVVENRRTPPAAETRFLTVDGDVKIGCVQSAPVEYDGEPAAQVVVDDVTAARTAENELARRDAFAGSLLSALDGLFFVFDLEGGLVDWNDRLEAVTRYDESTLSGMHGRELVPESERESLREHIERLRDGERARYDSIIETRDGETIPHEFIVTSYETDDKRYAVGIAHQIEDRIERERRIRERKEQLETLVENFPVVLFAIDEDQRFTHSTGAGLERVGLEPGEVVGARIESVYAGREDIQASFQRAFDGESVSSTVDVAGRTFETRFRPLFEDGDVTQVIGAAFDVTNRVEQREELEAKNQRLEEFASVVSHDLRNPLGVASGALDLLESHVDDAGADHLESVTVALDRMDRIIDDVLALARGDRHLDVEPVPAGVVADTALETVPTADVDVTVTYDALVRADEGSLARVFENLLRNAVEHGGDVVRVDSLDDDPGFYVADDGPGIPESERDAVLDPGVSDGGTGLGLAIVSKVAAAHDWSVAVTEDDDLGGARVEVKGVDLA